MTVPAIVGRLYDGSQLVRTMPFPLSIAPPNIMTNETQIPNRLMELQEQLGMPETITPAEWVHVGWENNDILTPHEWIKDFGKAPPEGAVFHRGGEPLVAVRYAEYQRKGQA